MQQTEAASLVGRLVGFTLAVGLVEETVKAIPIFWIASRQPEPLKPLAIAYLGAISGLAFGVIEAVVYSLTYASDHAAASLSYGQYVVVQVLRFVSLPLLHGIWSATLGYFIGLAFCLRASKRVLLVFGLSLVTIMHGLYNTFAGGWFGLLVAIASLLLFIGYVRSQHFILSGLLQANVES
jgi:RsiW-degrading membrane proteinase PrsW (M82 family)